jgi:hypothetical protein
LEATATVWWYGLARQVRRGGAGAAAVEMKARGRRAGAVAKLVAEWMRIFFICGDWRGADGANRNGGLWTSGPPTEASIFYYQKLPGYLCRSEYAHGVLTGMNFWPKNILDFSQLAEENVGV